jgi:hypothetical protein
LPPTPDIAGFKDAQKRLRNYLGQEIDFQIPVPKTWGPDVALDPETGEPYDPTAVLTSGGGDTIVTVKATVIFRPIKRGDEDLVAGVAAGVMNEENVALYIDVSDFASVEAATGFSWNGKDYRITDMLPDGLTSIDHYIVYGEAR